MNLTQGSKGELTVLVDGREVARTQGNAMPSTEQVLAALGEPIRVGDDG